MRFFLRNYSQCGKMAADEAPVSEWLLQFGCNSVGTIDVSSTTQVELTTMPAL
jgi:hypothetical protein